MKKSIVFFFMVLFTISLVAQTPNGNGNNGNGQPVPLSVKPIKIGGTLSGKTRPPK